MDPQLGAREGLLDFLSRERVVQSDLDTATWRGLPPAIRKRTWGMVMGMVSA